VTISSDDPLIARPNKTSLTLPHDQHFDIIGGDRAGSTWIRAAGPGLFSDSIQVRVGKPMLRLHSPVNVIAGDSTTNSARIELLDHRGNIRVADEPVTLTLSTTNYAVAKPDSVALTVPAGQSSTATTRVRIGIAGTALLRAEDTRQAPFAYEAAVSPQPIVAINLPSRLVVPDTLPRGQRAPNGHAVQLRRSHTDRAVAQHTAAHNTESVVCCTRLLGGASRGHRVSWRGDVRPGPSCSMMRSTRANKPDGYLLGSQRIATAPEPNSSRLMSFKSTVARRTCRSARA
jgi:hypothetical protein